MKIASFLTPSGCTYGFVVQTPEGEDQIVDLFPDGIPGEFSLDLILEHDTSFFQQKFNQYIQDRAGAKTWKSSEVRLLPMMKNTAKLICVGLNYIDHAKEFGDPIPNMPVIFSKGTNSLSLSGAPIVIPRVSTKVDYEGELVILIGKQGRYIHQCDALEYVAGYCCGNDVTARDWQKERPGGQWFLGKSFDTFAPVGPYLVTPDEVGNPNRLRIQTRVNGRVRQNSSTENFIFPVEVIISYISQVMTLNPGDLIFTGTPPGVGGGMTPPEYLFPGDVVEIEIEKIGTLTNPIVSE